MNRTLFLWNEQHISIVSANSKGSRDWEEISSVWAFDLCFVRSVGHPKLRKERRCLLRNAAVVTDCGSAGVPAELQFA
jgi:hypothetical protein